MVAVELLNPKDAADQLFSILSSDRERLSRLDRYRRGVHDDPYTPENAGNEYKLLVKRASTNWIPTIVGAPCQSLWVDGVRSGRGGSTTDGVSAATSDDWARWQSSGLDSRQWVVHADAVALGHSFVVVDSPAESWTGKVRARVLSPLRTAALFRDPANDVIPLAVLTVNMWGQRGDGDRSVGRGTLWVGPNMWDVSIDGEELTLSDGRRSGFSDTPVVRFVADIDSEGRATGIVEPIIPTHDRLTQTVFDWLVVQSHGSFVVRTVTGMAPPVERDSSGNPVFDDSGAMIPKKINFSASRLMVAEDPDTRFGSLDGTPLDGYIAAAQDTLRQLFAQAQIPPHYLLGQMANLSAEALQSAEIAFRRLVEKLRKQFGESWERVISLMAEGDGVSGRDDASEVVWRDIDGKSLAATADALGKLSEQLGVPKRALWDRIPGVTQGDLARWEELADAESSGDGALTGAILRASQVGGDWSENAA